MSFAILECLQIFIETNQYHKKYALRFRQLLRQIFSNDSILQIAQPVAIDNLRRYSVGDPDHNLAPVVPAFGMILQNLTKNQQLKDHVEPCLRNLAKALADRSELTFNNLISQRQVVRSTPVENETVHVRQWETTGACYSTPRQRLRPFYEGRDSGVAQNRNTDICNKYYDTYKKQKLTGGLMAFWCPHLVCLGFHMMPTAEGRDDVFSGIFTHWPKAPRVIVYDFACQLAPYCLVREPEFFQDTLFVIDEMHSTGHSSCSQAFFLQNYMLTRASLKFVNSSAAECGNAGLSRIRKSVSYMSESHAILYTHTFVSVWNRRRIRYLLKEAKNQVDELRSTRFVHQFV